MNSRRRRVRNIVWRICATAFLCAATGVSAQTIYKLIDAAGRTIFTDQPAATGVVVPYTTFPGQERGLVSPQRIANGTRTDLAEALFSNSAMTSMYAATIDFNEAARRLWQARESRREGVEPRPGERTDSSGASAMNQRYQRRQQRLERAVVAAERRSHETSLVRSALLRTALSRSDGKRNPLKLAQP